MIYLPFLGALALAVITILEKKNLRKKISIKSFQVFAFLSAVIVMLPLIYFFWDVKPGAWEIRNLFILFSIIIFSIIANLLAYYSLKGERVSKIEPARVLEPLFVILLTVLLSFFIEGVYERKLNVLIPSLISASALIVSHIKKSHLQFSKYFIAAVLGSFAFALELVLSKIILPFYSPISFYFLRCTFVFLISFALFRPKLKEIDKGTRYGIFLIGALWVVYRILVYYGYLKIGIMSTTLIIMLGPALIYLFAWKFLKEKIEWRNIIASLIIIGSVIYVIFF
jgi:drug/metabolite transporter (DMT)-like permease